MRYLSLIAVIMLLYGCAGQDLSDMTSKTATVQLDADANGGTDITKGGTNATTAAGARTNLAVYSTSESDGLITTHETTYDHDAIALNTAKVTNATHTGDVTGSTALTITAGAVDSDELASTAVAAGSYTNTDITVDEDGRITAASSGSASVTVDSAITDGSSNPVENNAIYDALALKADTSSLGTAAAADTGTAIGDIPILVDDGSSNPALNFSLFDASGFSGNLATTDDTFDEVFAKIDALSVSGTGGYVSTPTYSDGTCTVGQWSFDASYIYICEATDTWDRYAVTFLSWSNPTPVIPNLSTAVLGTDGVTLTLTYDVAVTQGTGYADSQLDVDASTTGSDLGVTYSSGDGTTTHVYTVASTINSGETVDLDFDGTADSLESSTGGDLAAIVSASVTNNSTQGGSSTYYLGWPNTDGVPDSSPSSYSASTQRTFATDSITLTSACTVGNIQWYTGAWDTTTSYAGVYRYETTEWVPVCYGTVSPSGTYEWTTSTGITSGTDCTLDNGDEIRLFVGWDGTGTSSVGRSASGQAYYAAVDLSSGPGNPVTWTSSTSGEAAIILECNP